MHTIRGDAARLHEDPLRRRVDEVDLCELAGREVTKPTDEQFREASGPRRDLVRRQAQHWRPIGTIRPGLIRNPEGSRGDRGRTGRFRGTHASKQPWISPFAHEMTGCSAGDLAGVETRGCRTSVLDVEPALGPADRSGSRESSARVPAPVLRVVRGDVGVLQRVRVGGSSAHHYDAWHRRTLRSPRR